MTTASSPPAIAATGLRKSYGDKVVLDGIDLHVAEGTIFAMLGPNGAGKTTAVQILSTYLGADAGDVHVAGHDLARDPDAVRAAIGVTGQFSAVDKLLTGEENLILMADLHHLGKRAGRLRAAELLERFDLVEAASKPLAAYSGGMRRRLDLAMTLVGTCSAARWAPPSAPRAAAPHYINYLVPGIIVMAVGSGCASTAVSVNADMTEGIIARFRTMAISRASVLTGHVAGSMIRTMTSIILVFGVALLMGFRPTASPVEWIASIGVISMFVLALTWLAVALGMAAKSPEGANGSTLLLQFGPFLSSAFVRPESMPAGMRWFAENMPFTPMIDTLRGLLLGTPIGNSAIIAVAWCVAITLSGYLWARAAYHRDPAR